MMKCVNFKKYIAIMVLIVAGSGALQASQVGKRVLHRPASLQT